jgi:hypothetical protein
MPSPSEKLANSLEFLEKLQATGHVAIRAKELPRAHRERLKKSGFLREVMKGWYVPGRPDEPAGESTAWYASFWAFCSAYLTDRFGDAWCLSAEQSLSLHAGNRTVPTQLIVRAPKASRNVTQLLFGTSLLDVVATLPSPANSAIVEGMRVYALPAALIACSPGYFRQHPTDARTALAMVSDASDILKGLLQSGQPVVAGRLAGAFRNIGRARIADDILNAMRVADYDAREVDPFEEAAPLGFTQRIPSPYLGRIRLMWHRMREPILTVFPQPPGRPNNIDTYMARVEETYLTDAYHSLSIEGYRVSRQLIERVRSGAWNPDNDDADREHRNALAARGYWQASQAVRESVKKILTGENAGKVADDDHGDWYRQMFAPSVQAGILKPADLAGYRDGQVFIRHSMHVPPNREGVRDAMPEFFNLLREEVEPAVRVVLGHFVFVYIHPYMDGNGRMGRFLMNAMLASGGYPWTVVPVERRKSYVEALEQASVKENIRPFAELLGELVGQSLRGRPAAQPPR